MCVFAGKQNITPCSISVASKPCTLLHGLQIGTEQRVVPVASKPCTLLHGLQIGTEQRVVPTVACSDSLCYLLKL